MPVTLIVKPVIEYLASMEAGRAVDGLEAMACTFCCRAWACWATSAARDPGKMGWDMTTWALTDE